MATQGGEVAQRLSRPWPVHLLVVLSVAGLVWTLTTDPRFSLLTVIALAGTGLLAWGLWNGRPWAFSMSFMFATLCVALTLTIASVQIFLLELAVSGVLLWAAAVGAVWIVLLMHPATKRFAELGVPLMRAEVVSTPSPEREMRDAPWTVKAFAILNLVGLVVWMYFAWDGDLWRMAAPAILNVAIVVGLLRGYRGAWLVATLFAAISVVGTVGIVTALIAGNLPAPEQASGMVVYVLSTVCLFHPLTRDWTRR